MTRRFFTIAGFLALMIIGMQAVDGPLTPLMSLRTRTDANGYLMTTMGTYTAPEGPLTPMANLRGRTDANGYLMMALNGALSLSGIVTTNVDGISTTSTPGFITQNSTAATLGAPVQYSPSTVQGGTAFNSTSGLSETHLWKWEARPATVAGTTTSVLYLSRSINGGAYGDIASFSSGGIIGSVLGPFALAAGTSLTAAGGITIISNNTVSITAATFGTSPTITHGGRAYGFTIQVGTGGTANTGSITLPNSGNNGWLCDVFDLANTATIRTVQTGYTTTTATFASYSTTTGLPAAWPASAELGFKCNGF